jgi:hypothetical protein
MCSATTSRRFSAVLRERGRRLTVIARGAKQSIAPREGRMDCFVRFAPRNDGGWIRLRDLAARGARSFAFRCPSQNSGRRDGRVRAAPAVSCATCTKKTHTSIQVWRRHPTFPAQWLYGLLRARPGDRLACHRHYADRSTQLDASTGASGPHDFTVRNSAFVFRCCCVHRNPPQRLRRWPTPL